MKKTILYSLCGCLVTGASVAVPIYIDLGENSSCPAKQGMCAINPGQGNCCPANYVVTGISNSSANDSKIFGGVYTDNGTMLFDKDGSPVDPKEFTSEERSAVVESLDKGGGETARLGKQEYNQGTLFWTFDENGELVESQEPTRGNCDKVKISLVNCTEYKDRTKTCGGGQNNISTCCKNYTTQTIYYKSGAGYYSDSNFTNPITTLAAPTFSGHTFRGYFTTFWGTAITDTSSYIANYSPYRTIGHSVMPRTSSGTVELPSTNWAAGWGSCGTNGMATMQLYAGWAENCKNNAHCEVRITGSESPQSSDLLANGYVRMTSAGPRKWQVDKSNIIGDWLPGAVEYRWKGDACPSGSVRVGDTTISLPYPYGSSNTPITQYLTTANLGCDENTPTNPTRITINYYDANGTKKGAQYCTVGDNVTLSGAGLSSDITTFKYMKNSDTTTFYRNTQYSCSVGTGGFAQYTTSGDNYVVELEPASTGGGQGEGGDSEKITVTLDLKGGDYSGGTTLSLEDGAKLPTGITRGDGAVLDYWYPANASESASNKVTEIDKSGGKSQTFAASYKCPETEGSEGKYYMNGNGTCVQNDGYYINGDTGETMSPSQVSCYNNNGTPVYCYFKGTVRLHDKPNGSNLTVTNGNEGTQYQTLWCNRAYCLKGNSSGDFVPEINLPRTTDYTFRGYFLQPDQQVQAPGQPEIELITDHSTTAGEAFGRFYPRNTANGVTSMTIYDVFDMVYVTTTPLQTSEYNIDLYGAWARNCETDPELNPAGCLMRLGQTHNTNSYGLGKGDVRYDTECVGGKHLTSDSGGTYNPQCEDDTGDITFTYNFHNQYGETIECGSVTPSACTTGNNVVLVSTSNFNAACGNQYTLRYLHINDEWFRPSYQAGCNTNVFGQGGKVTIDGYACEICKDEEAPEHGKCMEMTSSGQINYNPINPDYYGVGSSGHDVGYGGLWGADPSGPSAYSACRRIVCDGGYQLWTDNNGVRSCITEYEACVRSGKPSTECDAISFSCPSSGYTPAANSNVTISGPSKSGTSCSYTIGCSAGVPEWSTGTTAGSTVVTCTGDQCTANWVQNQLNGKSCFVCPHYNGADWSVSPGVPTQSGLQCTYHILCNGRVACPRILKKDGITINGNSDYVTCDEANNHQCTAGYGTYQSLYYLMTEFAKYECVHNSSGINDCGETSQPEYTCPTTNLPTIDNGEISSTGTCYYQPTCASGYTCNTSTQLCSEHACNNEKNCNALFAQYRDHASDLCQEPVHVDCPDPTGTGVNSLEHGEVTLASSTDTRCTYGFECTESGYQLQGSSTAMCSRNNTGNLCSRTWLNSQINSHSCQFNNGKGDDGEDGDGGDKEGGDTNSES